jgi:hypothetical protein
VLTNRNFHFVSPKAQEGLRKLKVLIAGCGSGGGACAEPLLRLGVGSLRLADSGSYELTNYNRQRAYVENIGENKALFQLRALKRVNPHADLAADGDGITPANVRPLVSWADLVFDCVDVTSKEALRMKLKLHESAQAEGKPTFVPMDLGFCQTGMGLDYRNPTLKPLFGKVEQALACTHPIKALLAFYPLSRFPGYTLQLVEDAIRKKPLPISQMGCASDLLSAVAATAVLRYVEHGEVLKDWHIDLDALARPLGQRWLQELMAPWRRRRLRALLRKVA